MYTIGNEMMIVIPNIKINKLKQFGKYDKIKQLNENIKYL